MAFAVNSFPLLRYPCDSSPSSSTLHIVQLASANSSTFSTLINPKVLLFDYRKRHAVSINCQATADKTVVSGNRMLVFVPPHPLIKHWISVLRNEQTPNPVFKNAMAERGRLLIYEASREWLPTVSGEIESPMGPASVEFIDPREPTHCDCSHIESWPGFGRACTISFAGNKNVSFRNQQKRRNTSANCIFGQTAREIS